LKFAHLILCGLAAVALPVAAASAKERTAQADVHQIADVSSSTLFPGSLDMPIADGSNVPADCQFPETLTGAQGFELACVENSIADEGDVGVEYISWLGQRGWRHTADIIGGLVAVRETENGCEQVINIYPHGDDNTSGIWFALQREPRCAAAQPQTP